jgi:C4-dicarboxylate-specific signal transduction histidine kinase
MIRGQDQMESVDLQQAIQAVFPILQGEAAHRGIGIRFLTQSTHLRQVQANEVMLQRIVFNLAANAMDALSSQKNASSPAPAIQIELLERHQEGRDWVILQIQDNGPGLPAELFQQMNGPVVSSKAQGSGLSLLLTQSMLRLWGGHTVMQNLSSDDTSGAVLQLWMLPAETDSAST